MKIGPKGGATQGLSGLAQDDKKKTRQTQKELAALERLAYQEDGDAFSPVKYGLGYNQTRAARSEAGSEDALSALTSNPALLDAALKLAYYSSGDPRHPTLSKDRLPPSVDTESAYNLNQVHNALQLFGGLRQHPSDAQLQSNAQKAGYPNASDYLQYSGLPYSSRLLDPPHQRLLQAQLMGDPSRVPSKWAGKGPVVAQRSSKAIAPPMAALSKSRSARPAAKQATPAVSGPAPSAEVQQLLSDGEQAFNNKDFKGAYDKLAQALQASPGLAQQVPSLNYYLGVAAEYSGDPVTLAKAQGYYQNFVASPSADPNEKAWVEKEMTTGLPAQVAIQSASDAYKNGDYDSAFNSYENALNVDPSLAQSWPAILYQLGTSAENAKDPNIKAKASGYYQQYAASPDADPKTVSWVNNEIDWLKVAGPANAAVQKAQDDMWKNNDPYNALSGLKAAVENYPQLAQRSPDVYYYLALYAYSSADVPDAKKYLAQAQSAMGAMDPSSDYAKYWNDRISQLSTEVGTFNLSNWSSDKIRGALSTVLGNGKAAQLLGNELGRGMTSWWVPMTGARGARNVWQAERDASYRTGDPDRGFVTTSGTAQKTALNVLDNKVDTLKGAEQDAAKTQRAELLEALKKDPLQAEQLSQKIIADENAKAAQTKATKAAPAKEGTDESPVTTPSPAEGTPGAEDIQKHLASGGAPAATPTTEAAPTSSSRFETKTSDLDSSELGPGWWGLGTTLAHAQTDAMQWYLGQDSTTGKVKGDWRGPFGTLSNYDPSTQGVTLAQGGKNISQYRVGANLAMNVGNAEARVYDMVYGGSSIAHSTSLNPTDALGVGGMLGAQARLDDFDMQGGLNFSGGSDTIGGTKINSLISGGISGTVGIGSQADAMGSLAIGKSPNIGASIGAFSGAQATGCVSGTIDGVGAALVGQAWAGLGAKATANLSYHNGKATLNLGLGAALGVGGFVDLALTIDFGQIADELKGIGTDGVKLAKSWGKDVPVLGQAAGFVAGSAQGISKLAGDTLAAGGHLGEKLGDSIDKLGGGVGKIIGEPLKQASELLEAPKDIGNELDKKPSQAFSDAKSSVKKGRIVTGAAQGIGGSIKWVGNKIVGLFK